MTQARHDALAGRKREATEIWRQIAGDAGYESRQVLQAWQFLRWAGVQPAEDERSTVLGVAAEVAVGDGHDLLIAFRDRSVRYLNHAGGAIVVEDGVWPALSQALDAWFGIADSLAMVVGVWDRADLPDLPSGHTRILMLTPAGKRFGQGPDDLIRNDRPAQAFLNTATQVLVEITSHVPPS